MDMILMRKKNDMKNILKSICKAGKRILMILCMALFVSGSFAQKKAKAKAKMIEITMKVVDKSGEAVPGATVVIGEGHLHATTNADGEYTFNAKPSAAVSVKMLGYETYKGFVAPLADDNRIVLTDAEFLTSSADVINLPFSTTYKRYTTDNVTTISGEDISKYPTSDIRNAMIGLLPGYISTEKDGQPGLSSEETNGKYGATEKVSESSRGQGLTYIIDDIPVDITEMPLDPDEIESITLLKDAVSKALYGPMAANGVIYIKTKRGAKNERKIHVNLEAGVSVVDRFPEYVSGAEYASLNNQARLNSGLDALYNEDDIAAYAKNNPYDMLHPSCNFRDLIFKNTRSYRRASVGTYGGNEKVQYSAFIGYTGEGDIYKIGSTADYNRVNVRSNLDMKLNKFMKLRFDFAGNVSVRQSPNYKNAAADDLENISEFGSVIVHANTISPIAFPIYTGFDEETGLQNYGISASYPYNPIGGLKGNGYYTEMNRSGIGNIALDIDLGSILKGLKSTTYVGFNGSYLTRIGKEEEYGAYKVIPLSDISDATAQENEQGYRLEKVRSTALASGKSKLHDYYSVRYSAYERLSYDNTFGKNMINAGLTLYMNELTRNEYKEPLRQANAIFNATYAYDNKYILQGVVDYVGNNFVAKSNRYKAFPVVGAAWVISDEKFMKNQNVIDYLKVRAQVGQIAAMNYRTSYKYETDWNIATGNEFGIAGNNPSNWTGGNGTSSLTSATYGTLGNTKLDWEHVNEISAGIELMMLKRKLFFDLSYYNKTRVGIIEQVNNLYPDYAGFMTLPYVNFGEIRYTGYELVLSYKDKVGKFSYSVGAMANFGKGKNIIVDEPNYPDSESYRSQTGKQTGAITGLVCLGKYATDEEAANDPIKSSYSSDLVAGDLKYKDMNGDNVIDNRDFTTIGNSTSKMNYSFNINLAYQGFEISAVANGICGCKGLLSNSYYRNGWGNDNYSTWVRDNIGGDYPRLTYYQVTNNFQNSTFWMRNTDFFKLQNVEVAYNLCPKVCENLGVGGIRIFARGANLLTISGIKDTDPESMSAGVTTYPLYSTYVGGLKITF